jgi:zinc transport system substrate-binding protein
VDRQTKSAIFAITVIIPISSLFVLNSDQTIVPTSSASSEISVIASFYPLYEFANEIGQDKIKVTLLVPPGIEPHDWEPRITDLQKMHESDLILINGIGFESWLNDIDTVNTDVIIVDTSEGIPVINNSFFQDDPQYDHSLTDPHIWLNPVMAKIQVSNIADALVKIDPVNEKFYKQNELSYLVKLDSLNKKIKNELSTCKKDFIAFHNAFSYFALQYNLNQHTIINSNELNIEPTSKTLIEIINLAQTYNIGVIFTEDGIDPRSPQVIANEINARVLVLSPIEFIDENFNYFMKMENNLENLKEALCN